MAINVDLLKFELARIKREIEALEAKLRKMEGREAGEEMPFAKLRGIWKGADFTYAEIKEAEYKLPEADWA